MKEISEVKAIAQNSSSVKILKGLVISIIITFILLFIFALVLTYTNISENTIGPVVIAITGVSILARKFYDNKLNKEKWNFKWRNNRTYIYVTYIFNIKHFKYWIYVKCIFNIYASNWNCCWDDRGSSRS